MGQEMGQENTPAHSTSKPLSTSSALSTNIAEDVKEFGPRQTLASVEKMEGVEHSNIKVVDSKWAQQKIASTAIANSPPESTPDLEPIQRENTRMEGVTYSNISLADRRHRSSTATSTDSTIPVQHLITAKTTASGINIEGVKTASGTMTSPRPTSRAKMERGSWKQRTQTTPPRIHSPRLCLLKPSHPRKPPYLSQLGHMPG
ncbi:hypothetical protein BDZ91DRAFT_828174 [Kalaharituber pfeilii]|nr:hypothetical protein BDZ91DRAFT_828174 [Kalaharituber pfeilii]